MFFLFSTIMLSIVVIVLSIEITRLEDHLSNKEASKHYYRSKSSDYFDRLLERAKEIRELRKEVEEWKGLYKGKKILAESLDERVKELTELTVWLETELGNVQADLIDERYVITQLNEEIEKLEGRNKWLQYELENEFEWSMLYSESVDKYARLYDEALKESARLEGELEQTQETLNMLEYGYQLLQDENKRLKTDLKYYREKYEGNYDPID